MSACYENDIAKSHAKSRKLTRDRIRNDISRQELKIAAVSEKSLSSS